MVQRDEIEKMNWSKDIMPRDKQDVQFTPAARNPSPRGVLRGNTFLLNCDTDNYITPTKAPKKSKRIMKTAKRLKIFGSVRKPDKVPSVQKNGMTNIENINRSDYSMSYLGRRRFLKDIKPRDNRQSIIMQRSLSLNNSIDNRYDVEMYRSEMETNSHTHRNRSRFRSSENLGPTEIHHSQSVDYSINKISYLQQQSIYKSFTNSRNNQNTREYSRNRSQSTSRSLSRENQHFHTMFTKKDDPKVNRNDDKISYHPNLTKNKSFSHDLSYQKNDRSKMGILQSRSISQTSYRSHLNLRNEKNNNGKNFNLKHNDHRVKQQSQTILYKSESFGPIENHDKTDCKNYHPPKLCINASSQSRSVTSHCSCSKSIRKIELDNAMSNQNAKRHTTLEENLSNSPFIEDDKSEVSVLSMSSPQTSKTKTINSIIAPHDVSVAFKTQEMQIGKQEKTPSLPLDRRSLFMCAFPDMHMVDMNSLDESSSDGSDSIDSSLLEINLEMPNVLPTTSSLTSYTTDGTRSEEEDDDKIYDDEDIDDDKNGLEKDSQRSPSSANIGQKYFLRSKILSLIKGKLSDCFMPTVSNSPPSRAYDNFW
mmetsp:Transcript_19731/g.24339  ORF Transcript_19731/g.24339 Transcript_19731/m.24339 type:complete len:591 (+) Transcript_19731:68-1840(+)